MTPNLFLELLTAGTGLYFLVQGPVPYSLWFFILNLIFIFGRLYFPARIRSLPIPVLAAAGILLAAASGWHGVQYLTQHDRILNFYPDWGPGLFWMFLSAWFLLESFPFQGRFPAGLGQSSSPFINKDSRFPVWIFFLAPLWLLMFLSFYSGRFTWGLAALADSSILLIYGLSRRAESNNRGGFSQENRWLLSILVFAALLRYPFGGSLFAGFQGDEANDALSALKASQGLIASPFITGWWGSPALPYFLQGLVVKALGPGLWSIRIFSLSCSLAACLVFYRWTRLYFSAPACLAALFLFSISWWHLFFAFSPFTVICTVLFEICAYYFLEKGFQQGLKSDFWWAGIFAGLAVMTYLPGRAVPFMLFSFILACGLFAGGPAFLKTYRTSLLFAFLAFLWVLSPFLRFIVLDPPEFFDRMVELNIFTEVFRTGQFWLPLKTTAYTLLSFFWTTPSGDGRFMVAPNPLLDPLAGLLLLTGFILTLFNLKKRASWAALSGIPFGIAANALAIHTMNPNVEFVDPMRMFFILPFVMFMAARACQWFFEGFSVRNRTWTAGCLLALAGALFFNAHFYFFQFRDQKQNYGLRGFQQVELSKIDKELIKECHLISDYRSYSSIIEYFSGISLSKIKEVNEYLTLPVRGGAVRDVAFLFPPEIYTKLQLNLRKFYPKGEERQVADAKGTNYVVIFRVPRADFEAARQGLPQEDPLP